MRIVLLTAVAVVLLLALSLSVLSYPNLAFLAVPICPAVALVVVRRHSQARAFTAGALTTFGSILVVILPIMVVLALGGYDSGESCENGCLKDKEGFVIALLVVAVPVAIVGGIVSSFASRALVRSEESAHP